jgi:hypothetical protein
MTQEVIEVAANSLEEAREQIRSRIPTGLQLLSETVISDGKPKTARAVAETTEAALAKAQDEIPHGAEVVEKKEVAAPESKVVTVEAFDEQSAREEVSSGIPRTATLNALKLVRSGSKGFLGIGKKPNQYEAEVFHHAVMEITYKEQARVSAKIGYANRGMRHDTMSQATAYWMARMPSPKKDPYVMYTFEDPNAARTALLELPCIHEGEDQKLICTEVLIFGCYQRQDGIYEAIVCGDELTHELWEQARESFTKHGGNRKNDLEPEKRAPSSPKAEVGRPDKVAFVREERKPSKLGTGISVYRIYNGPDAASAKAFLDQHPVTQQLHYLIVETPEGNYCRDIEGFYKE